MRKLYRGEICARAHLWILRGTFVLFLPLWKVPAPRRRQQPERLPVVRCRKKVIRGKTTAPQFYIIIVAESTFHSSFVYKKALPSFHILKVFFFTIFVSLPISCLFSIRTHRPQPRAHTHNAHRGAIWMAAAAARLVRLARYPRTTM